jgi:CBS domain-containing protein
MSLERVLKKPVETLPPDASCTSAARRMRDCNVGTIVVENAGRPLGIVTDRDIVLRVVAEELDPEQTSLRDVMSGEPVYLASERSLDQLIAAMRDLAIRRVPVVDEDGMLQGIVSMDDLIILLAEQFGSIANAIRKEIEGPSVKR